MKKILTIIATAGFLSVLASSASAQTASVNMVGTVGQSCNIASSTAGILNENASPATSLNTTAPGTVTVICNTTTSTLNLTQGTNIIPLQANPPVVTFEFAAGGTGIYSGVNSGLSSGLAGDTTSATGDVANITSKVAAAPGKLLAQGVYTVDVIATLTP